MCSRVVGYLAGITTAGGGLSSWPEAYALLSNQVWSAFRESSFGHGLMDFMNDTTAVWNWQRNQDPAASKTSDKVRTSLRRRVMMLLAVAECP